MIEFRGLRWSILAILPLVLAACATSPAPVEEWVADTRVRQPAQQESAGVQVFPLENSAVTTLLADASEAEQQGQYEQASMLLERALRIQPHNPEVLQTMAEVQLQMRDWEQALNFAARSYDLGPRVGEICARNWRTIGVSREYLGDQRGSVEAAQRVKTCMVTKPEGL